MGKALLVYRLTGSSVLVGTVNFAQFIGVVLLAPWAGGAAVVCVAGPSRGSAPAEAGREGDHESPRLAYS